MLLKLTHIESNLSEMGSQYDRIRRSCEESKNEISVHNTGGQITARDVGDETGRSLETIIAMDESIGVGQDRSQRPSNLDASHNNGEEQDFDPRNKGSLASYKRFLLRGDDEQVERTDTENALASSYQADESSSDPL